jgi:putative transposase
MPPIIIQIMAHKLFHRKQIRLKDFDYSQEGGYFITICVKNRVNAFGKIVSNSSVLNKIGLLAEKYIMEIASHYCNVEVLEYIIMPDHIHMIIIINNANDIKRATIAEIIKGYKQIVSRKIHLNFPEIEFSWQRSFHDHIIRNYESLDRICDYIKHNPERLTNSNNLDNQEGN